MTDTLEWNYSSGSSEAPGDLFYPMNGTGNLEEEGIGQLLPVAAADYADADSTTVMPASAYNAANCREAGEVYKVLQQGLLYDQRKAEFLENYLDQAGIKVEGIGSGETMSDPEFWDYFTENLEDNSQKEIREQSPLPDWMAKKSVNAKVFLEEASRSFPVPNSAVEAAAGYQGSDLYLPLQSAEASVAKDKGLDAKVGISSEEPFDDFTSEVTGFPAFRSQQPVSLSGEEVVPYAERSDPENQVLLSDSPQEVAQKLDQADQTAVEQIQDIAMQLDDDLMQEVFEQ